MSKKDEALKLALEALELEDMACRYEKDPTPEHIDKAITALREALAEQPAQQEPEIVERIKCRAGQTLRTVRNPNITARESIELANWIVTNTAPPAAQRTWVGLTDEEVEQVCVPLGAAMLSFTEVARAIEAKLREKNA